MIWALLAFQGLINLAFLYIHMKHLKQYDEIIFFLKLPVLGRKPKPSKVIPFRR